MIQRIAFSFVRTAWPTRYPKNTCYRQFLSTSPCIKSEENFRGFQEAIEKSPVLKKLADNPEAIKTIVELGRTLKDAGLDITPGKKPSMLAMLSLFRNAEIREQMQKAANKLSAAGIDVTSKEVMEELMVFTNFKTHESPDKPVETQKSSEWWRFK